VLVVDDDPEMRALIGEVLSDKGYEVVEAPSGAEALERVREGTNGICQACGCRIPRRRLEAMPTATLCVPCQEQREVAHAA
jgi:RNA polymerase-binding transcription factor DksA